MFKTAILIILTIFTLILGNVIQAKAQTVSPKPNEGSVLNTRQTASAIDECSQMLNKVLTDFQALKQAKADVDAELETNKLLVAKTEIYNAELLKAVDLLVSSEKRNKGFFKKLLEQLGKALKVATKAEHLTTIAALIVIIKNLR